MKIYTIKISKWRKAKGTFLDISRKSGEKAFAPTWDTVIEYKNKVIDEKEFKRRYYDQMRSSWKNDRLKWDGLFELDEITIGCYCLGGTFCHRYLFVEMLIKAAESMGIDIEYCGEIE